MNRFTDRPEIFWMTFTRHFRPTERVGGIQFRVGVALLGSRRPLFRHRRARTRRSGHPRPSLVGVIAVSRGNDTTTTRLRLAGMFTSMMVSERAPSASSAGPDVGRSPRSDCPRRRSGSSRHRTARWGRGMSRNSDRAPPRSSAGCSWTSSTARSPPVRASARTAINAANERAASILPGCRRLPATGAAGPVCARRQPGGGGRRPPVPAPRSAHRAGWSAGRRGIAEA